MEKAKGMWKGMKGFTLVELMVVMAIIAVLSAIVVPTVTGVTTKGSTTGQKQDVSQIQTQVDSFNTTDKSGKYPTLVEVNASGTPVATPAWDAGELPTAGKFAGIDWTSESTDSDGSTATFFGDYVKVKPRHADESATETADDGAIKRWRIDPDGIVSVVMDGKKY